MKPSKTLCWAVSAACAVVLTIAGYAASPRPAEWMPLFNGRNLDGWQPYGAEKWIADHGTILGQSVTGKYGYLMTTKTYRNFEIRLKFNCASDGNSGLFFHSRIIGENPKWGPDIVGLQAEIDPSRHTGGIYESGGRGWLALPSAAGEKAIKPLKQWNSMEVLVEGNHIVTHLNGTEIANYTYTDSKYTDGHLGLQLHTGEHGFSIRFKGIYLRELP